MIKVRISVKTETWLQIPMQQNLRTVLPFLLSLLLVMRVNIWSYTEFVWTFWHNLFYRLFNFDVCFFFHQRKKEQETHVKIPDSTDPIPGGWDKIGTVLWGQGWYFYLLLPKQSAYWFCDIIFFIYIHTIIEDETCRCVRTVSAYIETQRSIQYAGSIGRQYSVCHYRCSIQYAGIVIQYSVYRIQYAVFSMQV